MADQSILDITREIEAAGGKVSVDSDIDVNTELPQEVVNKVRELATKEGYDPSLFDDPEFLGAAQSTATNIMQFQKDSLDAKRAGMPDGEILDAISQKYQEADDAEREAIDILKKVKEGEPLGIKEGIGMLFAAVIPAVAGMAMGGKRGAASAFAAGGSRILQNLDNRTKMAQEVGIQEYKTGLNRAQNLRGQAQSLQKAQMEEEQYQRRREDKIEDKLRLKEMGIGGSGGGDAIIEGSTTTTVNRKQEALDQEATNKLAYKQNMQRIIEAVDLMEKKGENIDPEIIQRYLDYFGYKLDPGQRPTYADLNRAKNKAFADGLQIIKGNASESEADVIREAEAMGINVSPAEARRAAQVAIEISERNRPVLETTQEWINNINKARGTDYTMEGLFGYKSFVPSAKAIDTKSEGKSNNTPSLKERIAAARAAKEGGK